MDLVDLTCDLLVIGDTHRPLIMVSISGRTVVNPGSVVSMPVVDLFSAGCGGGASAVLEVTFHDVGSGGQVSIEPWN